MNCRNRLGRNLRLYLPLLGLFAGCAVPEQPQDHPRSGIVIQGMWGTPGLAGRVSAAYGTITNNGTGPDTLVTIVGTVAPSIEVHQMVEQEGIMRMRGMKWPIIIEPGDSLAMVPGGTHLMLMELHKPLTIGDSITLHFRFTQAGEREVRFKIGN